MLMKIKERGIMDKKIVTGLWAQESQTEIENYN